MVNHPRIVIAAPASSQGKTTVATGLLGALRRRERTVAPFKVGPDYIDPGYHRLASDRPGRNLDPVLVGEQRIAPLFRHGAGDAELSVVEGVMGLFDGRIGGTADGPAFGSTAHVARLLEAPIALVVDANGHGQSMAALLHGFRSWYPQARLGGVIFNRVGSERHEQVLREAADSVGLPVLGALSRTDGLSVPSRHLGLVTAAEHGGHASEAVESMADAVERGVDLEAVAALARSAPAMDDDPWSPATEIPATEIPPAESPVRGAPRVAVCGGPAFSFGYTEHVELLQACGAEVVPLDPMRHERLPDGTAGLVLPGGFPEQHVAELSANRALCADVGRFAATGAPVHAECGGLLYLAEELDEHPLCGVLPAKARMSERLTLGYRDAVAVTSSVLFEEGMRVSGHEFHRTVVEPGSGGAAAWRWGRADAEGFVDRGVHASYVHTHPAGQPESVARFVRRCAG